jgi:RNA polymerase sigma-70 factor (ECF subfamily)
VALRDQELISNYLGGNEEAVRVIDVWIASAARSYAIKLGEDWDDVLQEARIEVFRLLQSGRFRAESRLKTYLWRVVNNTCLDAVRNKERWQRSELRESDEICRFPTLQAEDHSLAWETVDLVLRVLEQVPEDCKRVWELILDGYSYREMSKRLGISESALRVRALRCRKRALAIRDHLETGRDDE